MTGGLYPQPPHLVVAVYSAHPEAMTFAALCDAAQDARCRPTGLVEVAPHGASFEFRSDLAEVASQTTLAGSRLSTVLGGQDSEMQMLRAGFRHDTYGVTVVTMLPAPEGDRHPVGIAIAAGPLGLPEWLHSETDMAGARELARWSTALLRDSVERTAALFGAIGVELQMPTPGWLRSGEGTIPSELYVSQALLTTDPDLAALLAPTSDATRTEWPRGRFTAGWSPFRHS